MCNLTLERAPTKYTVTFDANGHGTAPAAIANVTSGSTITAPTAPTAQGWTFDGWYTDADCTTAWDFDSDTVTADTTLYAKWEAQSTPPVGSVTKRTIPLDVTSASKITDTNGAAITPTTDSEGSSIYSCPAEGWSYRLNQSKQIYELTLSGVDFDIQNTTSSWGITAVKIILADGTENRISTVSSNITMAAINASEITGSGSLTVSATSTSSQMGCAAYGIYNQAGLTLDGCSIVVDGVRCNSGSASGIGATYNKTLTIKANTDKDNTITVKNVQGKTESMGNALGRATTIVAEGAYLTNGADKDGNALDFIESSTASYVRFKDTGKPMILSFTAPEPEPGSAVFTDGLGNDCAFDDYTKGAENEKGYTFAGWFDPNGNELTSAEAAAAGTTYTAKWTKNGKTVRTTGLDLTEISETNTFGATYENGVYTNAAEGWSWDTQTKTLTFSGAMFDVSLARDTRVAVRLPDGATVATAANTENVVSAQAEDSLGCAIVGDGSLTFSGEGSLKVVGADSGICAGGNLAINAPIDVSITGDEVAAIYIDTEDTHRITIHDELDIQTPTGGVIGENGICIYESDGVTPARHVVIGSSAPVSVLYTVQFNSNGGSAVGSVTVNEGDKLTAPTAPTKAGYTFQGWYTDAACTTAWDFDTTVTGDMTLYAKWNSIPVRDVHVISAPTKKGTGYENCTGDKTCPIWRYTDVSTTAWYHDGVHYCIENGYMTGYGSNLFGPNDTTSRAMIVTMLWRQSGSPIANYALSFEDVAEDAWYADAIRWAVSEGVAGGYGNGKFGPNDSITREQMVTMLYRYAKYKGYDVSVGEDTNILSYLDFDQIDAWAIPAMQWACGSCIVKGKSGGRLDPLGSATRAEAATIFMRYCEMPAARAKSAK